VFAALWNLPAIWPWDESDLPVVSGAALLPLDGPQVIALRASEPVQIAAWIYRADGRGVIVAAAWACGGIPKGVQEVASVAQGTTLDRLRHGFNKGKPLVRLGFRFFSDYVSNSRTQRSEAKSVTLKRRVRSQAPGDFGAPRRMSERIEESDLARDGSLYELPRRLGHTFDLGPTAGFQRDADVWNGQQASSRKN